ncbi:hypothetical protein Vafri_247 [Volvox africanus]|nr:hypothetical protein Vafri_247 [Volvox africanus]
MDAVPADVAAGVVLGAAVTLGAGIRCKQQLERTAAAVAAMPYSDWGEAKDMTMASSGGGSNGGDLLVFHAATSGVRPLPMICFYYRMHMFFGRHKPQRSWPLPTLNKKSHVYMDPTYVPDPGRIKQAMRATRRKATLSCLLLKLLGREREAKRLGTSFLAWAIINNSNLEEDVTFSVKNVLALETLLLAPYSLSAAAAATADTKVEASGSSGGNDDDDDDDESNPIDTTLLKAQEQQLMLRQPLLPVVWRSDWGPLLDAMMVDVVQRLMGIKLVPPPPPRHK